eukprot:6236850-Pyramimonas_sp.AAC.1
MGPPPDVSGRFRLPLQLSVYSHGGRIRCRKHMYILTADQSDESDQNPARQRLVNMPDAHPPIRRATISLLERSRAPPAEPEGDPLWGCDPGCLHRNTRGQLDAPHARVAGQFTHTRTRIAR